VAKIENYYYALQQDQTLYY